MTNKIGRFRYAAVVCFFMLAGITAAASQGAAGENSQNLFAASFKLETEELSQPLSKVVVRQRSVRVRFGLIRTGAGHASFLRVNLFQDAVIQAVCDFAGADISGSCVWTGHADGSPGDRIVMAVSGDRMGAYVHAGGKYFQIRPVERDLHVIREIDMQRLALPSRSVRSANAFETDVAALVNQERLIEGLHGLKVDDQLTDAAQGHSADMAANDYVDHVSLDGREFTDRIADAGYPCNACGENVAGGGVYSTPELVMAGWMASPGHRENILREIFCDIGVGYVYDPNSSIGHFWTQNFGRMPGVDTCPPVTDGGDGISGGTGSSGGGGCFVGMLPVWQPEQAMQ